MDNVIDSVGLLICKEILDMSSEQLSFIKKLFYCRICLWIIALVSTIYWIYWSFHLYTLGYEDEHVYAAMLRPIFTKALLISLVAVGISFVLRRISDNIKDKAKYSY